MRQVWSPVFCEHPSLGQLYFSSILNRHASWLDGHAVFGALPHADRPYQCVWGDGSPLGDDELGALRAIHERCTVNLQLVAGDLLVVDNLRVAHGRSPFQGARRMGLLLSDMVKRGPQYSPHLSFRVPHSQ